MITVILAVSRLGWEQNRRRAKSVRVHGADVDADLGEDSAVLLPAPPPHLDEDTAVRRSG